MENEHLMCPVPGPMSSAQHRPAIYDCHMLAPAPLCVPINPPNTPMKGKRLVRESSRPPPFHPSTTGHANSSRRPATKIARRAGLRSARPIPLLFRRRNSLFVDGTAQADGPRSHADGTLAIINRGGNEAASSNNRHFRRCRCRSPRVESNQNMAPKIFQVKEEEGHGVCPAGIRKNSVWPLAGSTTIWRPAILCHPQYWESLTHGPPISIAVEEKNGRTLLNAIEKP